jgi:hypothetical protein
MSEVGDATKVKRTREALRRLKAMRAVFTKHGNRTDSGYRYHDAGAAQGLKIAIDEIEEAMRSGKSRAAGRGI